MILCLGGAGYAAASDEGETYGDHSASGKAQSQDGVQAQARPDSRPGRLGAGPSR